MSVTHSHREVKRAFGGRVRGAQTEAHAPAAAMDGSECEEQKHLLQLFQNFHVHSGLSITEIREITAKVFVDLEACPKLAHRGARQHRPSPQRSKTIKPLQLF